jgi:hypothetical protein
MDLQGDTWHLTVHLLINHTSDHHITHITKSPQHDHMATQISNSLCTKQCQFYLEAK